MSLSLVSICSLSLTAPLIANAHGRGGYYDSRDQMREMRQAQREAEREQREAQREAEREQREAQREAERRQWQAEQEARQQQQQAERDAQQQRPAERAEPSAEPMQRNTSASTTTSYKSQSEQSNSSASNASSQTDANASKRTTDNLRKASKKLSADDDNGGPPPTMEKLFKRWFSKKNDKVTDQTANIRPVPPPAARPPGTKKGNAALKTWTSKVVPNVPVVAKAGVQGIPAKAKSTLTKPRPEAAQASRRGATPPPLLIDPPPAPELLAIDASPKAIAKARALGFSVEKTSRLDGLGLSLTALIAPSGMSAEKAKEVLDEALPDDNFAPNKKYRIYKTATGVENSEPSSKASGRVTFRDCAKERCFPEKIIGWKPKLKKCAEGAKIGIIDTAVDLTHPAFARKKIAVAHFAPKSSPAPDWHGTGVTALLAGDGRSSTPGLIPDARFYLADVFHADSDGQPASDTLSMLRAFEWLEARGVKVINLSLSGPRDALLEKAVQRLATKGIFLVAAAGNEGPNAPPSYPAAYDNVIAVTAVDRKLRGYRYANRGNYVDVAAPGVAIWTALPDAKQGFHSGTSFATPFITATVAAITARNPDTSPSDLLERLSYQDLGAPGPDPIYGKGLIRAPESCAGGLIAQVSAETAAPAASVEPAALPAFAASARETLPWLGFSD